LFLVGLQIMTKEDKVSLLAQLNTFTELNVINDAAQRGAKQAKKFVLGWGEKAAQWLGQQVGRPDVGRAVGEFNDSTDWDAEVLQKEIRKEINLLADLNERQLSRMLRARTAEIAEVDEQAAEQELKVAIINRAKRALGKDFDNRIFVNSTMLEEEVYAACIDELIEAIRKRLNKMTYDEEEQVGKALEQEMAKLSEMDQDAIKRATGLESLSSEAILKFLKTTSGVAFAQLLIGGAGFGAFLLLTTSLKALSLLLGVTLPFASYVAATTFLSFLLSGPFLLLIIGVSGGLLYRGTTNRIHDQLAKLLLVTGRLKYESMKGQGDFNTPCHF
jgi:hypothetical protein